ncbi:MAG TPA: hypothetical protein VFM18_13510 [Methanosarcina sp.]|nr:hypothetical protein [Methanosarcina sp.]
MTQLTEYKLSELTTEDTQLANKLIAERLEVAMNLISECESIADTTQVGFSWDLAYGMGGWYEPRTGEVDRWGDQKGGWQSSSSSC